MMIAHAIYALSNYLDAIELCDKLATRSQLPTTGWHFPDGSRIIADSAGFEVYPPLVSGAPTITDAAQGLQRALNVSAAHAASVDVQVSPINVQTISEAPPRNVWQVRVRVNSHTDYSS